MGIQALPQTTVRALGASLVLADPAALVKELVDNALDANATNIAIEIHSNTLDVIQVRDNGHGVPPEDRPLVARRYCTSKINHDKDLRDIGGSSLGFRGEALASAAELSGTFRVSTRIEGEQTATVMKINQQGEVVSQEKSSLPTGTTIRITDFIKANPVRRQIVLKDAENCVKTIKKKLQTYALARSDVRLALRILRTKNTNGGWVYAPKPNGNAKDAAYKVVGAACASQCTWSTLEDAGYTLHSLLPRVDADPSKISSIGAFISVDCRPVSSARGTFKQICKAFREALKRANSRFENVRDPFIYLELSCPKSSYDANIEPAKDDVLFEDSDKVMDAVTKLLATIYMPELAAGSNVAAAANAMPGGQETAHEQPDHTSTSLDIQTIHVGNMLTHNQREDFADNVFPLATCHGIESGRSADLAKVRPTFAEGGFRSNMYGCDEEDVDFLHVRPPAYHMEADIEELRQARNDINVSNPWITAKLNAPVRYQIETVQGPAFGLDETVNSGSSAITSSSPNKRDRQPDLDLTALPTPRQSSPSEPAAIFHRSDHVPSVRLARDGKVIRPGFSLPPPSYTLAPSSDIRENTEHSPGRGPRCVPPEYDYGLETTPSASTPLSAIPVAKVRRSPRKAPHQGAPNKPFVLPMINQPPREKVWFDHLLSIDRPCAQNGGRRTQQHDSSGLVISRELGDLAEDQRPLTPPKGNRDIREFVVRNTDTPVASMIERRKFGSAVQSESQDGVEHELLELTGDVLAPVHQRCGFIPASELMTTVLLPDSVHELEERSTKRRKSGTRNALRELSTKSATLAHDAGQEAHSPRADDSRPQTKSRAHSRKNSRKAGHRKSSKLPLERVPRGQGTHELVLRLPSDINRLRTSIGKIDLDATFVRYNEPALPVPRGIDEASSHLRALTASLHQLLVKAGNDSDVTGSDQLLQEVKAAFAQRNHSASSGEG